MGCINSKLRAEDVVGRCKARKRLIKQVVEQRHAFAAAHAAYIVALRNTGAALRQFAEEEGGLPACGQGPLEGIPEPPPPPPLLDDSPVPGAHVDPALSKPWDFAVDGPITLHSPTPNADPEGPLQTPEQLTGTAAASAKRIDIEEDTSVTFARVNNEAQDRTEAAPSTAAQLDVSAYTTHYDPLGTTNKPESNAVDNINNSALEHCSDDGNLESELSLMRRLNAKKHLPQIVREIDEEFLKASAGGIDVGRILETGEFRAVNTDLSKARTFQSARVFSAFSWNWSRSPLRRSAEMGSRHLEEAPKKGSHALTLERLLAWERKLFEEIKVVEALRAEQTKKCSLLRRQETREEDAADVEKTRAELKRLHSLILVCNHGVDSTVEAIEDLRDDELHPQLVELIGGLMNMWMTMHRSHARQTHIIVHIKNIDATMSQEPTTEAHHQTTLQLEKELLGWHESFCKLVASQRGYMAALYGWLKLTLIPIPTGKDKVKVDEEDSDQEREDLDTCRLCEEWQRALGCLPDRVASEAIKSLAEVVKAMVAKQAEEMKQKRKTDKLEKQWEKKVCALRPFEEEETAAVEESRRRRIRRREEDEEEESRAGQSSDISDIGLMERRATLVAMRKRVEGEMIKHGKAVQDTRVLTMNNLQTGLPGVLEAMNGFSAVCSQAFQHLHSLTTSPYSCCT